MPWTKTIAAPKQPPRVSRPKPIRVSTNAPALTTIVLVLLTALKVGGS
jgi:hypothetical protein